MYSEAAASTSVPFTYGSVSFWNGKRTNQTGGPQQGLKLRATQAAYIPRHRVCRIPSEHTHRWIVFVRHPDDCDLSFVVSKVVFTLHSSFADHIRGEMAFAMPYPAFLIRTDVDAELTAPPFFVAETGWGEFDVGITIHLHDPRAEPISIVHRLKLYPAPGVPFVVDSPVVDEHYDEVVFNSLPTDATALARLTAGALGEVPTPYGESLGSFSADADLSRIQAARRYVLDRRLELHDRLMRARLEAHREKDELRALGAL